jgi:redox-regulated HSP33 family molecular chaperone
MEGIYRETSRMTGRESIGLKCKCGFDGTLEATDEFDFAWYEDCGDSIEAACPKCNKSYTSNSEDIDEMVTD